MQQIQIHDGFITTEITTDITKQGHLSNYKFLEDNTALPEKLPYLNLLRQQEEQYSAETECLKLQTNYDNSDDDDGDDDSNAP